ncbi:MAG: trigger factor [Burkholderiales bacterium]|nr:trigger factor [Burkholderiales bacterium]
MQQEVENLGALQRRLDISVPAETLAKEVQVRLARLARSVKMPGFRPGKVPMKMVASSYGAQVQAEVLNDKIGEAFNAEVNARQLRVAGTPTVAPRAGGDGAQLTFSATFEVYPEIRLGELGEVAVERAVCPISDAEIDKTIDIMRRQRAVPHEVERPAADGDRVTVDYKGSVDGVAFDGGAATGFPFTVGQGRMLPEFEAAVRGMVRGEAKTFPLTFPADYRATELAGKAASFDVTVTKVEQMDLPALDAAFARQLGVRDGDLAKLREEVRGNLEREVKSRLRARTKESVMAALLGMADFELPKSLVEADSQRLVELAKSDLAARGVDGANLQLTPETFAPQAQRRVRLGLMVGELVRTQNLAPRQEQIRRRLEELAQSYEKPAEVIQWYLGNRQRLAEVETMVMEDNVVDWVLQRAKVTDTPVAFDELMGSNVG